MNDQERLEWARAALSNEKLVDWKAVRRASAKGVGDRTPEEQDLVDAFAGE